MTAPVVSEIDYHVEARLAGLIRRRFLWMSGTQLGFGLLLAILFFTPFYFEEHPSAASWRNWIVSQFNLTLLIAAGIYVWRAPPNRLRLLRFIFWLIVIREAIDLIGYRIPGNSDNDANSFLWSALKDASFGYFFTALFIRWSVREAVTLAGSLLVITFVIAGTYIAHPIARSSLKLVTLSPLWFLPGLVICWWSHSRLRTGFRQQFESMQYRRFQSELISARKLHESLMPRQVDEGPVHLSYVYEPMREIGGDLIFLHKDSRSPTAASSVIILDVTGHGIAAALTVNRLVGEIERLFGENSAISPRQLIRALDRYIALTLARHGIFATAFCSKLNCELNLLEWHCGGHPPAFIQRGDGSLEKLESTGPMLGIYDESFAADNQEHQTRFEPGDVLLCYTDGAIEAMNADRQMLGVDGVEAVLTRCATNHLPPGNWSAAILREVLNYRGAPAEDDTLIAAIYFPSPSGQSPAGFLHATTGIEEHEPVELRI